MPKDTPTRASRITAGIRRRIESGGERLWRLSDFQGLPFAAVAQALSRMTRQGTIERISKGVYYRSRQTALGKSRPNPAAMRKLVPGRKTVFPSGLAAANMLGFTTQTGRRGEVATSDSSLPRKLLGNDTLIHARRPTSWRRLSEIDAALLDFLRRGGKTSELSFDETIRKTLSLLSEDRRFERLAKIAGDEPPRVRALLGAFGQELGQKPSSLLRLRRSLNPYSRFDFGHFARLRYAGHWQARKGRL